MKRTYPRWACTHTRFAWEGSPYEACPGCRNQVRRFFRHWSALTLAVGIAFLVLCAAAGAR
jgi:hypothetical protein